MTAASVDDSDAKTGEDRRRDVRVLVRGAARVAGRGAAGGAIAGVLSRALLDAASGGEPLLLHHHGRLAGVLVDPDTWAELESLAAEAIA